MQITAWKWHIHLLRRGMAKGFNHIMGHELTPSSVQAGNTVFIEREGPLREDTVRDVSSVRQQVHRADGVSKTATRDFRVWGRVHTRCTGSRILPARTILLRHARSRRVACGKAAARGSMEIAPQPRASKDTPSTGPCFKTAAALSPCWPLQAARQKWQ